MNLVSDQNGILQTFSNDFCRRFKKTSNVCINQALSLSKDISTEDNDWLTKEMYEEEVWQAVKQIGPLEAHHPDGIHVVLSKKCWSIIGKTI